MGMKLEDLIGRFEEAPSTFADALPNLVFVPGEDDVLAYANEAYAAYTGLDRSTEQHFNWWSLVHEEDREGAMAACRAAQQGIPSREMDVRLLRADGVYRWHLMRFVPVEGRYGLCCLASATDIDERRRAEDFRHYFTDCMSLLVSSLNYRDSLRRVVQRLVPTWADCCTIDVLGDDRRMKRIEVACAQAGKIRFIEQSRVGDWPARPGESQTISEVLAEGESVFLPELSEAWIRSVAPNTFELEQVLSLAPSSLIIVPLRSRNHTVGAFTLVNAESGRRFTLEDLYYAEAMGRRAGIAIDNAMLYQTSRRATEQLKAANRTKDEFLGLMSHELRTPITTIYGNARVLQRLMDSLDRDALASALDDIKSDAERLHLIIENLLALARSDASSDRIEPVLVRNVLGPLLQRHRIGHPRREVEVHLTAPQAWVLADPSYFELILRNLINNAEKYSPSNTPVEVYVEQSNDEVIVRVLDRGRGIAAEELEAIFEPFFRSPLTRDRVSGVGIGLTVCKRLVEAQGGRIWVRPRNGAGVELGFALRVDRPDQRD